MANLNKVFLMGNLTRDPELRYTPSGTAVADIGLAVNRRWKGQDGQSKEETLFIDVQAWTRSAEVITEYCKKGSPLFVEGRLRLDSWDGKDGQKHTKVRVVLENFQFIGAPGGRRNEGAPPQNRGPARGAPRPADELAQPDMPEPEPEPGPPGNAKANDDIPF